MNKKEYEWFVEQSSYATKTGFVIAKTKKEAQEKVDKGEWEALDISYKLNGKARVIKRNSEVS